MKRHLLVSAMLVATLGGCGSGGTADGNATSADGNGNATLSDAATIETTGSPATIGAYGAGKVATPVFVAQAALGDMYELASAKLALARSQSAEIKAFAQQMIADHGATTAKLTQLAAGSGAAPLPAALDDRRSGLIATLQAAAPDKFDEVYLDQQGQAHREALGLMDSYATHGDDAGLKAFAAETKPRIQMHMEMVSKLDHGGADEATANGTGNVSG
jgi:putative membrane protein